MERGRRRVRLRKTVDPRTPRPRGGDLPRPLLRALPDDEEDRRAAFDPLAQLRFRLFPDLPSPGRKKDAGNRAAPLYRPPLPPPSHGGRGGDRELLDDLRDRGAKKRLRARLLLPIFRHAKRRANLPDLDAEFRRCLDSLDSLEREGNPSCDAAAETFGALLGAAFAYGLDGADARILFEIGRHTGRFIYFADAAEDYDDDRRRGNYNPLVLYYGGRDLTPEEKNALHTSLLLELTALERAVALLPPKRDDLSEITDNILYIGLVRRIAYLTADPTQEREPGTEPGGETE